MAAVDDLQARTDVKGILNAQSYAAPRHKREQRTTRMGEYER